MARTNNYSSWIFLGAALVAGAGAFWLSHVYLKKQEEKLRTEVAGGSQAMTDVVVASGDLKAGSVVAGSTMSLGRLPKAYVSSRFVTPDQFSEFQGHALVRAKSAGEPLLKDDVGGLFVERFSDLLKPGERAITLEATEINADSGLLLPGDRVDLYAVLKDPSGGDSSSLVPLLESVHVLAAGPQYLRAQDQKYQSLSERDSHYDAITVAVSVEDAEKLILARKAGDIAYALRNSADDAKNVSTRLSSSAIGVGGPAAASFGGSDSAGSYEYFSSAEPAGVIRQMNVPAAGVAGLKLFGGAAGAEEAAKELMQQVSTGASPGGSAEPVPPAAAPSGAAANAALPPTSGAPSPATKMNGTKRE